MKTMKTIKNTKQKEIGKIYFFFVLFLFISFFIHDDSKAQTKTWVAPKEADYVQKQTDGALHWMITEGHTPMPTFKTSLTDNQRWELVNYIRTLAKNKK